jgi:hypothetical protein
LSESKLVLLAVKALLPLAVVSLARDATQPLQRPTVALAERKALVVAAMTAMTIVVSLAAMIIVRALRLTRVVEATVVSTTSFPLLGSVDAWRRTVVPHAVVAAEAVEMVQLLETDEGHSHRSPFASETKERVCRSQE